MPTLQSTILSNPPGIRLFISNVAGATDFVRIYRSSALEDEFILAETDESTYNDYTSVNGILHTYRAVEVSSGSEGAQASITRSISIEDWWLVDTADSATSIKLFVDGSSPLNITSKEEQSKFTPLGRRTPVVIKDHHVKSEEATFTIQLLNHHEVLAFHSLRRKQKTLLLQSPVINQQWFFVFDSDLTEQIVNVVDDYRLINFGIIEVDRPSLVPYQ